MGWWRPPARESSGPGSAPTRPARLRRVAALIAFCLVALLATLLVQYIWTGLLSTNLRVSPAVPWSVLVMAILLWAVWRYAGGAWWPARTHSIRRRYRRANTMPGPVFWWAMGAGLAGLGGLVALWLVVTQLIRIPGNQTASEIFNYPLPTVVLGLVMAQPGRSDHRGGRAARVHAHTARSVAQRMDCGVGGRGGDLSGARRHPGL